MAGSSLGPGDRADASAPFLGLPRTAMGWAAVCLAAAFFVLIGLFGLRRRPAGGPSPLPSDPLEALLLLAAAATAIAGGASAVMANALRRERSFLLLPALLVGLLVLVFTVADLMGG